MDLHPLIPPDLARLEAEGDTRYLRRGPVTFTEVLARASAQMDLDDLRAERERDPVAWLRAHRPWNRLIDRLLHGRGRS